MKSKKAVFFSSDAIIALSIIILVIVSAYPLYKTSRIRTEVHYDLIEVLSTLKNGEISSVYVQSLISSGKITDLNKTLLEQIAEFSITDRETAKALASSVLSDFDTKENIGLWVGDNLIYSKNSTPYESSKEITVTRQIISGILGMPGTNSATGFSARAYLSKAFQSKYFYFGGYVGDGNISQRIEYSGNISSASLEIAANKNFSVYVNDIFAVQCAKSSTEFSPSICQIPLNSFASGSNEIEFRGDNLYVAGGFLKIGYLSNVEYEEPTKYYFPGIEGRINIYDGFYIPSTPGYMKVYLHLDCPYKSFLNIGNKTIFNSTTSGEQTIVLSNSDLSSLLDYSSLAAKTTPIRFGLENVSLGGNFTGNADIILITDTSGSMAWRMDSDSSSSTNRNCTDPLLNNPSTSRISLAKCIDKDFASTLISSQGNRVGLVSFSQSANNYLNLTSSQSQIENAINSYTASGSTCVSCAINRAYQILSSQSDSSRQKYIIVMTDGVANDRSTAVCNDLSAADSKDSSDFGASANGLSIYRDSQGYWKSLSSPTLSSINDIELLNSNFGFAVGDNGLIMKYDGSWSSLSSPVSTNLNGLSIYNSTFAIAVGASGKIIKWDGSSWTLLYTISNNPTLYSVSVFNSTLMFASGTQPSSSTKGAIYKSTNAGVSWSSNYTSNYVYYGVKIINSTKAFAVGESGSIVQWSGSSWSSMTSPTTQELYDINKVNNTLVFAVGGDSGYSRIIKWTGSSWSSAYSATADSLKKISVNGNKAYALGSGATIIEYDGSSWQRTFKVIPAIEGNSTTGIVCTTDQDSCDISNSFPSLNANYSSCRARKDLNATVHSIGFGPVAFCSFAAQTLQNIANCGNGSYYASSDAETLRAFYDSIADSIIKLSYSEQTSETTTTNVSSKLYPDSYIEFNFTKPSPPFGLVLSSENQFSDSSQGSFSIPSDSSLVETNVVSYSGPRWTASLEINNEAVYNITKYGNDYVKLGDPFMIRIPNEKVNLSNTVRIRTGLSPYNLTSGSASNKIIYSISKNVSSFSKITAKSDGCNWKIPAYDNSSETLKIPSGYSGSEQCEFDSAMICNELNDAINIAVCNLLKKLDFNSDGKVEIKIGGSSLQISSSKVSGVPYTYGTEVQARVWR